MADTAWALQGRMCEFYCLLAWCVFTKLCLFTMPKCQHSQRLPLSFTWQPHPDWQAIPHRTLVIGIQNHTNNRERAIISGDIPCLLIPLFKTHQSSFAHTQSTVRLFCMQRVGQLVPGGLGVAEKAGSSFLCMRRNLLQVCVFPPWWISVGIYELSPWSWWEGDLSASILPALHVNLRQGFTQQTTLWWKSTY